jgi:hypothetical protein
MRGCIIFKSSALFALLSNGAIFITPESRIWIGFAFFVAAMSFVGLSHVRSRYILSNVLIKAQNVVYWAQPKSMTCRITQQVLSGKQTVRTHLTNGEFLDIDVFHDEMEYFKNWVNQRNSNVHWSDIYDNGNHNQTSEIDRI